MSWLRNRLRDDRGQVLLLAPVGLLVVLLLGAVTLEAAALHLNQRQLEDLADSLASDGATVGFDVDHFRNTDDIRIDVSEANKVVNPGIAISNLPSATGAAAPGAVAEGVTVNLRYDHEYFLGKIIFGATTELTATGTAVLERSP